MKIQSIHARNFRTLENFDLNLRPNYCAISGKNNAGKTAIIKIVQYFFDDRDESRAYPPHNYSVSFQKDATQWVADKKEDMEISITTQLDRNDDSEVFFVVQTFSDQTIAENQVTVKISQIFRKDGTTTLTCRVGKKEVEGQKASEILKKFRSASNLVVHNSTSPSRHFYYMGGSMTEVLAASFSSDDQTKIFNAKKKLQDSVKKAVRQHKSGLEELLGKLNEKYQVELSTIDSGQSSRFPLVINLTDKNVEVPLSDWGAGTQNRTRILMSVLDAIRFRSSATEADRSTPVFLVEEPESFLHPSAQAEFGQVLNGLAEELKIQIIATTHSPYMLNQNDPSANVLLERRSYRGSPRETLIKDSTGDDWMLPFADNLGIVPSEFKSWEKIFGSHSNKIVLVEGDTDKPYFETIKEHYPSTYTLPPDVEIVPYGGKDALKNTPILQFMINKFGKVFITVDLDALAEVRPSLERIHLVEGEHFCAVGIDTPGCDCIEGLLPSAIRQKVYADRHDLVTTAVASQDSKKRNSAKNELKAALLQEFKKSLPPEKDLLQFKTLFKAIGKSFD